MRRFRLVLFTLLVTVLAVPALAQTTATATDSNFNVSWAALDPGTDWAAQVIQGVFPVTGSGGVNSTQQTVISQMVGQLTGFVAAIAMAFLCYSTIMQIHRGAETGRLLANNMTGMFIVRLGFAAIMMFPVPTIGFSVGQTAVVKMSLWGVGMAEAVYKNTVQAIGPSGMVIATPIIPGTETIVLGLIQNELCRGLVNAAANNAQLVPEPTMQAIASGSTQGVGNGAPLSIMAYSLSVGNIGAEPACGTIMIPAPLTGTTNLAGLPVNQSALQQQAMTTVLNADIITQVQNVATAFYQTKQASALNQLQGVLTQTTSDYQQQLTNLATQATQGLRSSLSNGGTITGMANSASDMTQAEALSWTSAGAYYLEFAKLNGATLSLLDAVPQITPPTYAGLGPSLTADLAPLVQASQAYMANLTKYVTTQDPMNTPGGQGDLFSGATPGGDGTGVIEQVFRRVHLSDYALQALQTLIAPSGGSGWTDPFSSLMSLGDWMITLAVGVMGASAVAASGTGTALAAGAQLLTLNFTGAALTVAIHAMFSFLSTPLFYLTMSLLIPGLTIAFVLPMIPFIMWIAGVMGWLVLVCEAVIAVPLWMLAHMTMQGEGLHGRANEGYSLIFNVLFRPTLMIFGLFLGYFIFAAISGLIRQTFGIAAGFVLEHGWIVTNILGVIVLLSIFVMMHVVAALYSFRMISLIPHHVPRWIGFSGAGRVDMDQFSRDAATVGIGGTLTTLDAGLRKGMVAASKAPQLTDQPSVQPLLTGPGGSSGTTAKTTKSGMDTTVRAVSDVNPTSNGEE